METTTGESLDAGRLIPPRNHDLERFYNAHGTLDLLSEQTRDTLDLFVYGIEAAIAGEVLGDEGLEHLRAPHRDARNAIRNELRTSSRQIPTHEDAPPRALERRRRQHP